MTTRYQDMFTRCEVERRIALIPFLMLGDPDAVTSAARIRQVIAAGADGLELGIPYSDPVADGPIIVAAANRARAAGVTPDDCFALVKTVRHEHPALPIGLLVYANLVLARGTERFYADCAAVGVDSVLIPDAPRREVAPFRHAAAAHGIAQVLILPPEADDATVADVARDGAGYTYVLGRAGVTGVHADTDARLAGSVARLAACGAPPPVVGFGISGTAAVERVRSAGAAGAIVGSALVDAYARGDDVAALVAVLRAACGPR